MKNLILILSYTLFLVSCVFIVNAQNKCPNIFRCGDTLFDMRDSNKYPTVQIGTQCWFAQNIYATKYLNGDAIIHVPDDGTWGSANYGAWCDYNNIVVSKIYGHMYNWYVATDNRSICPQGWYVPSYNEFNILINYLGGANVAGGAMKQTGTVYWDSPNTGATNSSGFSGLEDGGRFEYGAYCCWNTPGFFASDLSFVYILGLNDNNTVAFLGNYGQSKTDGAYVRCMKDY